MNHYPNYYAGTMLPAKANCTKFFKLNTSQLKLNVKQFYGTKQCCLDCDVFSDDIKYSVFSSL